MSLARFPLASLLVSALLAVSVLSCQAKKAGVEAADIGFASLVYLEGSITMDGVPLKVGEKVVDGALLKTGVITSYSIHYTKLYDLRRAPSTTFSPTFRGTPSIVMEPSK